MVKEENEERIDSWNITFELDQEVKQLDSWEAVVEKAAGSNKKFVVTNNAWNGPTAADTVRLSMNYPDVQKYCVQGCLSRTLSFLPGGTGGVNFTAGSKQCFPRITPMQWFCSMKLGLISDQHFWSIL